MPLRYLFSFLAKTVYLSLGNISASVGISVLQRCTALTVSPFLARALSIVSTTLSTALKRRRCLSFWNLDMRHGIFLCFVASWLAFVTATFWRSAKKRMAYQRRPPERGFVNLKAPNIVVVWWMFGGSAQLQHQFASSEWVPKVSRESAARAAGSQSSSKPTVPSKKIAGPFANPNPKNRSALSRSGCQDPVLEKGLDSPLQGPLFSLVESPPICFHCSKHPPRCCPVPRTVRGRSIMDTRVHGGGDTGAPAALAPSVTEPRAPTTAPCSSAKPGCCDFQSNQQEQVQRHTNSGTSSYYRDPITNETALVANTFSTTHFLRTIRDAETHESER